MSNETKLYQTVFSTTNKSRISKEKSITNEKSINLPINVNSNNNSRLYFKRCFN